MGHQAESIPWTMRELDRLRLAIESRDYSTWEALAKGAYIHSRSANACRQAAYKYVPKPGKYYLRSEGHLIRKHGPPRPWLEIAGKAVYAQFNRQGRTRKEVADAVGVSPITLSNLMLGRRPIRIELYVAICEELELDPGTVMSQSIAKVKNRKGNETDR